MRIIGPRHSLERRTWRRETNRSSGQHHGGDRQGSRRELPRQLGSIGDAKAAYRLFDCGAVTRKAVMEPHLARCRAEAARHPIVLMVHDDTTLYFSTHRRLKGAGRVGNDHGTGFLAHSCLAVLPSGEILGLAHQTIWRHRPRV